MDYVFRTQACLLCAKYVASLASRDTCTELIYRELTDIGRLIFLSATVLLCDIVGVWCKLSPLDRTIKLAASVIASLTPWIRLRKLRDFPAAAAAVAVISSDWEMINWAQCLIVDSLGCFCLSLWQGDEDRMEEGTVDYNSVNYIRVQDRVLIEINY